MFWTAMIHFLISHQFQLEQSTEQHYSFIKSDISWNMVGMTGKFYVPDDQAIPGVRLECEGAQQSNIPWQVY